MIDVSSLPKITVPQIIAVIGGAVAPICVLLGVNLTPDAAHAVDTLRDLAIGLFGADAIVRFGRSVALGRNGALGSGQ